MSDVEVSYKGSAIGSLSAAGLLKLLTRGKYCEDDIAISYTAPGGSAMQSGTVTPASDTTTLNVVLNGAITHFVFYVSDFPGGTAGAAWHTVGGVWLNGYGWAFLRYNDANYSASQNRTVTATASSLSFSLQYKILAGETYEWYGW